MLRPIVLAGLAFFASAAAQAGELRPEEARRFVIGKQFTYTCFEGTRGAGRVNADGSVMGSIQFQGEGPVRYARLPAGTLHVKGESICASIKGMPVTPCFNVNQTDESSFRGSVSGLGFAYCDFKKRSPRNFAANNTSQMRPRALSLRPSLTASATSN